MTLIMLLLNVTNESYSASLQLVFFTTTIVRDSKKNDTECN